MLVKKSHGRQHFNPTDPVQFRLKYSIRNLISVAIKKKQEVCENEVSSTDHVVVYHC